MCECRKISIKIVKFGSGLSGQSRLDDFRETFEKRGLVLLSPENHAAIDVL